LFEVRGRDADVYPVYITWILGHINKFLTDEKDALPAISQRKEIEI
jgi:hypothetical protein